MRWPFFDKPWMQEKRPQVQRVRDLVMAAADIFNEGLDHVESGSMLGMMLELKPACLINNGNAFSAKDIKAFFAQRKIEVIIHNNFIINVKNLTERLQKEHNIAAWCGWDFAKSLEENISQASAIGTASIKAQMLAGFLLGFPESALRSYARSTQLEEKHIPNIEELFACPDIIEQGHWNAEDLELVQQIHQHYLRVNKEAKQCSEPRVQAATYERLFLKLRESYRARIIKLYRTHYNLQDRDIAFFLDLHTVQLCSPEGDTIFVFQDSYPNGQEPEDVKQLRKKVTATFL